MVYRFRLALFALAALAVPCAIESTNAQQRQPELVEDTSTVYVRVLVKPDTRLMSAPDGNEIEPLRPFQPLYVYGRDEGWLEVGRGLHTGPEGWIAEQRSVPWRQNLIVSFGTAPGRERQLFFETESDLQRVMQHESPIAMARELRRIAIEDGAGAAEGVAALEPEGQPDITQNFYIFPIMSWRIEEHPMTFDQIRVLELASLPLEENEEEEMEEVKPSIGVFLVIDTTKSMQPYIDETREAVMDLVQRIEDSPIGAYTRFGAIGFRDSPEAAQTASPPRNIEYRTKVFLPLTENQTSADVRRGLDQLIEASESTVNYHEDSVAGIVEAVTHESWNTAGPNGDPIRLRFVIIISDASPKPPSDPNAAYAYDPSAVRTLAQSEPNFVTPLVLHLITPDGRGNHERAEAMYREMSLVQGEGQSAYYPVNLLNTNNPGAAFRPAIDAIVEEIKHQHDASVASLLEAQRERELTAIESASLAMRLAWLGRDRNTGAPEIQRTWTSDRALEDPASAALDVRLLVTKNELSTMRDVLAAIVEFGESSESESQSGEFFELLRGALVRMQRDTGSLANTSFETLDEAVVEQMRDLPYVSSILQNVDEEEWSAMGSGRLEILDRVRARLRLFEYYHDDESVWTALYEGAPDGEHVFAMPLEALP